MISQDSSVSTDTVDGGFTITTLLVLETRCEGGGESGGANLVSCGGNGWVRFWNYQTGNLVGEFVSHQHGE